eukprot:GEMP01079676.1.p1 GENE.GEMP01079676.1~~GEMP01079676.1.p1  ORF type:complete len:155 (-),score=10.94 GEMP01079676.1:32-496(-)
MSVCMHICMYAARLLTFFLFRFLGRCSARRAFLRLLCSFSQKHTAHFRTEARSLCTHEKRKLPTFVPIESEARNCYHQHDPKYHSHPYNFSAGIYKPLERRGPSHRAPLLKVIRLLYAGCDAAYVMYILFLYQLNLETRKNTAKNSGDENNSIF